jgi:hypothetical protein
MAPRASLVPSTLRSLGRLTGKASINQTQNVGIFGADLGSSFEHSGKLWFLFGDTWPEPQEGPTDDGDSVAWSTDVNVEDGLQLNFFLSDGQRYKSPKLRDEQGNSLSVRGFEVPIAGVSSRDRMYIFYSTGTFDDMSSDGGLDAFWIGPDGAIGANWANPGIDKARWRQPFAATPQHATRLGSPVAAVFTQDASVPGGPRRARLYFVMSTWNPYNTVLLTATIQRDPNE